MTSLQRSLSRAVCGALTEQDMTQKMLAIRCDLSEKHVSQVLTGKAEGSFATWQRFAQALALRWQVRLQSPCREQGCLCEGDASELIGSAGCKALPQ